VGQTVPGELWENAWSEFVPFLDYDVEIRKIICSTNAIESRPLPPCRAGPRAFPQRAGRAEMSLPDHPVTRPDRQGQGTMGHKVETGPERVRHRIPRPHTDKMITDQIRSTVYLIDLRWPASSAEASGWPGQVLFRAPSQALWVASA
jgi:hypothetical protein